MSKKFPKITAMFFVFAALFVICGCNSDRYYQAEAADRAREYLLANAPELTSTQVAYVKFNDPILLVGDGLSGKVNGVKQFCITWDIPGTGLLYMVFGTARERMDNWYPNRLLKRNYVALSGPILSAVKACRSFAVTNFLDDLSTHEMNIVRFSEPEIITSKFKLRPEKSVNDPNLMVENRLEEPLVKEKVKKDKKKPVREQISLLWHIADGRTLVFCGTAANVSLAGWKLDFAGVLDSYEVNAARKKVLKKAGDYNTPIPVPKKKAAAKRSSKKVRKLSDGAAKAEKQAGKAEK